MKRILHILVALDQFIWVIGTLGKGYPDETISAAAWRMDMKGRWYGEVSRQIIDWIFFFDPDHCRKSFESERERAQLPRIYRIGD